MNFAEAIAKAMVSRNHEEFILCPNNNRFGEWQEQPVISVNCRLIRICNTRNIYFIINT
jgi:hypothetical protein